MVGRELGASELQVQRSNPSATAVIHFQLSKTAIDFLSRLLMLLGWTTEAVEIKGTKW